MRPNPSAISLVFIEGQGYPDEGRHNKQAGGTISDPAVSSPGGRLDHQIFMLVAALMQHPDCAEVQCGQLAIFSALLLRCRRVRVIPEKLNLAFCPVLRNSIQCFVRQILPKCHLFGCIVFSFGFGLLGFPEPMAYFLQRLSAQT